jgi:small-conductance mechanosensitive channel
MENHKIQILETLAIILFYIVSYFITKTIINNALKNTQLQRARRKIIIKAVNLFILITVLILLAGVWGLQQNEIAVFASTILTVLGIAFVAQWSLLSNITASILLFFNHPLKLGDTISVLDKEYPVEGEIAELTYFYVHLKTKNGDLITIPNSIFIMKTVSILANPKDK